MANGRAPGHLEGMAYSHQAQFRIRCCLSSAVLSLAAASCAGQSGNEGLLMGPPCNFDAVVAVASIEDIRGGCISVQINRVVVPGEPVIGTDGREILSGDPKAGTTINGHLQRLYAREHEFKPNDIVAVQVLKRSDDHLDLQVFPLQNDQATVHLGRKQLSVEPALLGADDCIEQFESKRETTPASDTQRSADAPSTAVAPPEPEQACGP